MVTVSTNCDDGKSELSGEYIERPEQVQKLIDEFELNGELREQGLMSLDGMYARIVSRVDRITVLDVRISQHAVVE